MDLVAKVAMLTRVANWRTSCFQNSTFTLFQNLFFLNLWVARECLLRWTFSDYRLDEIAENSENEEATMNLISCAGMTCHSRREYLLFQIATFSQFQVYLNVTQAEQTMSLLLLDNFYRVLSCRRVQKKQKTTNCCMVRKPAATKLQHLLSSKYI